MKNLAGFIFVMIIVFSNYLKAQDLFDYGIKVGLSSSSVKATDTKPGVYFNSINKGSFKTPLILHPSPNL